MPFLRVIRDKRGYQTTYLMHWYREGSRQRSKILYVFRSPGGARVGRNALEPETQLQLERQHPEIAFDWKAMIDNQQVVEPPSEQRRPRKRDSAASPAAEPAAPRAETTSAARSQQPPRPPVPSAIEGATPDEQIAFLALWYPRVRERVPKRTGDPARQEALLGLAERLNPANWTDADQIAAGLQQAAEALERLSHVFARRRRRSRRAQRADSAGSTNVASSPELPSSNPSEQ